MDFKNKKLKVEHLYSGRTDTLSKDPIEEKKIRRSAMPPMTTEAFRDKMELFRQNMGAEGEEFADFNTILEDLDRREMEERLERERQLEEQRRQEEIRLEEQRMPEDIELTLVDGQAPRESARRTAMRIVNNPLFRQKAAKITSWNKGGFRPLAAAIDQLQRSIYNGRLTEKELVGNLLSIIRNCNRYYEDHKTRRRSIWGAMRKSRVKELSEAMSEIVRDTTLMSPEITTYLCERMAMDRHPDDTDTMLGQERMTKFIQDEALAGFDTYSNQRDNAEVKEQFKTNVVSRLNHESFILSYTERRLSGNDTDGPITDRQTTPLYELHSDGNNLGSGVVLSKNASDIRGYKLMLKPVHYNHLGQPDSYEDKQNKIENDAIIEHLTLVKKDDNGEYVKDDNNVEHRKYVFERHVEDILSLPISSKMLSPKHIIENPEQAMHISALTQDYFLSITKTNRDLYLNLSEQVKRQVMTRLDLLTSYATWVQYYIQYRSYRFTAKDISERVGMMGAPGEIETLEPIMDKAAGGEDIQINPDNMTTILYESFYKNFQRLAPLIDEEVNVHTPNLMYLPRGVHADSARKTELLYREARTKQRLVKGYPDGCEQNIPGVYAYFLDATKQRRMAMVRAEERTGLVFDTDLSIKIMENPGLFQEVSYLGNGEPLDAVNMKRRTWSDDYIVRLYFYEKAKSSPNSAFTREDVEKFPFLAKYQKKKDFIQEVENDEEHLNNLYEKLMSAQAFYESFEFKKWHTLDDEMDWVDRFNDYYGIVHGILNDPTYLAMGLDEEREENLQDMKKKVDDMKEFLADQVEGVCGMRVDANGMYEYKPEKINQAIAQNAEESPLFFLYSLAR